MFAVFVVILQFWIENEKVTQAIPESTLYNVTARAI